MPRGTAATRGRCRRWRDPRGDHGFARAPMIDEAAATESTRAVRFSHAAARTEPRGGELRGIRRSDPAGAGPEPGDPVARIRNYPPLVRMSNGRRRRVHLRCRALQVEEGEGRIGHLPSVPRTHHDGSGRRGRFSARIARVARMARIARRRSASDHRPGRAIQNHLANDSIAGEARVRVDLAGLPVAVGEPPVRVLEMAHAAEECRRSPRVAHQSAVVRNGGTERASRLVMADGRVLAPRHAEIDAAQEPGRRRGGLRGGWRSRFPASLKKPAPTTSPSTCVGKRSARPRVVCSAHSTSSVVSAPISKETRAAVGTHSHIEIIGRYDCAGLIACERHGDPHARRR